MSFYLLIFIVFIIIVAGKEECHTQKNDIHRSVHRTTQHRRTPMQYTHTQYPCWRMSLQISTRVPESQRETSMRASEPQWEYEPCLLICFFYHSYLYYIAQKNAVYRRIQIRKIQRLENRSPSARDLQQETLTQRECSTIASHTCLFSYLTAASENQELCYADGMHEKTR